MRSQARMTWQFLESAHREQCGRWEVCCGFIPVPAAWRASIPALSPLPTHTLELLRVRDPEFVTGDGSWPWGDKLPFLFFPGHAGENGPTQTQCLVRRRGASLVLPSPAARVP